MKAYNLAMGMIFINAGIYITAAMNLFGDLSDVTGIFGTLSIFYNPIITIANIPIRGIDAIAIALAVGTIIVLNTNAVNDRGIAYTAFTIIFWGSFLMTGIVINKIPFPGIAMFYAVFGLSAALIFIITLVQMPTGGQKSFV